MKNANKLRIVGSAIALAFAMMTADVQAETITFTFDCTILDATNCKTGGPFGTLTLADSIVDPNRVDMNVVLNKSNIQNSLPPNVTFTGLNKFFVNYNDAVNVGSDLAFKMVAQDAAIGTFKDKDAVGGGTLVVDSQGPRHTTLDILLNPDPPPLSTFSGSLVLFSKSPGHVESNLDASMFNLKDANSLLYSAFNTFPSNHTFNAGATVSAIPEPETYAMMLAGLGLMGFIARRRKQNDVAA